MKEFLEWAERVVPSILWGFMLGYRLGSIGVTKVEAELMREKLEKALRESDEANKKDFIGKSSGDIIRSVLSQVSGHNDPKPR